MNWTNLIFALLPQVVSIIQTVVAHSGHPNAVATAEQIAQAATIKPAE